MAHLPVTSYCSRVGHLVVRGDDLRDRLVIGVRHRLLDDNLNWLSDNMARYARETRSDMRNAEKERKMYVGEFLDKLAASPRTWKLTQGGMIRDANHDCPHTYLDAQIARPFTGPGAISMSELCDAADNEEWHKQNVRKGLLAACGLL